MRNKNLTHIGLLVLRVFVGFTFAFHGYLKFQDMNGPQGTVAFFNLIGLPAFAAYLVAIVEVVAGLALMLGVFTLYSTILLAIVMAVAIFKVKWGLEGVPFLNKYIMSELDLTLLSALIALGLIGPGKYSVLKFCKCHENNPGSCKVCKIAGCPDDRCYEPKQTGSSENSL